jgi:hypothetical protein
MLERLLTYLWFALLLITSIASDESRKKVLIAIYSIMLDSIKKEDALDFSYTFLMDDRVFVKIDKLLELSVTDLKRLVRITRRDIKENYGYGDAII